MSYATIDDVFARYRPISSAVGSGTLMVTSADVASVFIAGAEGIVDGYAGVRYALPLPSNYLITRITADLAIFDILVEKLPQVPDFIKDRYDRSLKLLEQVASGTLLISSATVLTAGGLTDQEAWSNGQGYHSIFSPVLDELEQTKDVDRYQADYDERTDDFSSN